ncbi:MAG: SDR family NAD(P)-dependent oxidoreductase, partial [Pseudomonadota bacterium]|nr:SDR family NAD(P)-dependent oxidoreductase [Pseudomonadota bacterium]
HKVGPGFAVYAATKHAVRALSEGLRQEVKPYNIRTTVISPGVVAADVRLAGGRTLLDTPLRAGGSACGDGGGGHGVGGTLRFVSPSQVQPGCGPRASTMPV